MGRVDSLAQKAPDCENALSPWRRANFTHCVLDGRETAPEGALLRMRRAGRVFIRAKHVLDGRDTAR